MAAVELSKDNFQKEVLEAEGLVLIDFWASWCAPCRMLAPIIDEVAGEASGVKVAKVNVDKEQELAAKFGIMSIPTLVVMKGGKEVKRSLGYISKDAVLALLNV